MTIERLYLAMGRVVRVTHSKCLYERIRKDRKEMATIREVIKQEHPHNKVWVCPNEHSSQNITPIKYEYGITYNDIKSIPQAILDSECIKGFYEDNCLCLIWRNVPRNSEE